MENIEIKTTLELLKEAMFIPLVSLKVNTIFSKWLLQFLCVKKVELE